MSTKSHWEKIYMEKSSDQVSWTQEVPTTSIKFFNNYNIDKDSPIIDIGGGESKFVDYLIDNKYKNISVLDISKNAIERVKDRLGKLSDNINWIICDINDFNPKIKYSFWHDRAVFHFLTEEFQIQRYASIVNKFTQNFVVGTFSKSGPLKCSGLKISQYDKDSLEKLFCEGSLSLNHYEYINHITPFETNQNFIFCGFSSK